MLKTGRYWKRVFEHIALRQLQCFEVWACGTRAYGVIVQLRVKIIEVHGPREDAFYVDKNDADNDDKGGDIW